ncbi:hypothetical protein [Moraxella lacunata]
MFTTYHKASVADVSFSDWYLIIITCFYLRWHYTTTAFFVKFH